MLSVALDVVLAALGVAFALNTWSLVRAASLPDRVLALDTLYVNSVALIVVLGVIGDTNRYFEVALLVAALGFVSTVAFCRFLLRGDLIE